MAVINLENEESLYAVFGHD